MDAVLHGSHPASTTRRRYWNTLLRIERQDERDDHNTLMIYRIMYNTNSMNADTDYIEMAQLLGDAALPGEAAAVLEKAMSNGVIKDEHKERTNRLLNALKAPRGRRQEGPRAGGGRGQQERRRASSTSSSARSTTASASIRRPPTPSTRGCKRADQASGRGVCVSRPRRRAAQELRRSQEGLRQSEERTEHQPASAASCGPFTPTSSAPEPAQTIRRMQ